MLGYCAMQRAENHRNKALCGLQSQGMTVPGSSFCQSAVMQAQIPPD
jgi:hypothetical protein